MSATRRTLIDFVHVLDEAVPPWLSRKLLAEFEQSDLWQAATIDDDTERRAVRNSELIKLSEIARAGQSRTATVLVNNVEQLVDAWAGSYRERIAPVHLEPSSGVGLLRYRPGGFFVSHTDAHDDQPRTVSVVALLHSDFTGGELAFFDGQHVLGLKPGDACLFPSNFLFPHEVKPVLTGTRYSLVTWLR